MDNYPADVAGLSKKMVQATLEIYKNTPGPQPKAVRPMFLYSCERGSTRSHDARSNELRPTPMKARTEGAF